MAYLLILPLMNLPKPFLLTDKIQYADIVFIFLFIICLFSLIVNKFIFLPHKSIKYALILLIVVNLFSCLNSRNFYISIVDYLGLLYLAALFVIFFSILKDIKIFDNAIRVIFIISVLTSVIGILSLVYYSLGNNTSASAFLYFSPLKSSIVPFPRIRSTLISPEMFITFSQLGLVCGIMEIERQETMKKKILPFLGVIIIVLAALISYSRSLAGLFLTLSVIALYKRNVRFLMPFKAILVTFFIFLLCATVITSIWIIYPMSFSSDTNTELATVTFHTSPDIRAILRKAAFEITGEEPLFGIGQGMFAYRSQNYIGLSAAKHTMQIGNFKLFKIDPHCTYFGAMAETGFLGLMSMLVFFYTILRSAVVSLRESRESKYRNAKFYLFACFAGYLLTGWFVDIFAFRHFWINLALLAAISDHDD